MTIDIHLRECQDGCGRACAVSAVAVITHSPSEGYDNEKLGKLENDLGVFLESRLNDAIKKGGE